MPLKARLPFYNPLDPTHPKLWPDYSLILPICAVGNIGQLTCDLIISTLLAKQECQLIGRLYSPSLMPVVGPNAFNPKGPPTTSTEVYESKKHKLVIVQQRTMYFKNLKHAFIQELVEWIRESKFDQLVVLTSSFAQCNPDTSQLGELNSCPVQTITSRSYEPNDNWKKLNIKVIPDKRSLKVVQDGMSFLPGSGLTKSLIRACDKTFIPAVFLVDFCSEGINIYDCYLVANIVDRFLNLGCGPKQTIPLNLGVDGETIESTSNEFGQQTSCGWIEPYSWTKSQF